MRMAAIYTSSACAYSLRSEWMNKVTGARFLSASNTGAALLMFRNSHDGHITTRIWTSRIADHATGQNAADFLC